METGTHVVSILKVSEYNNTSLLLGSEVHPLSNSPECRMSTTVATPLLQSERRVPVCKQYKWKDSGWDTSIGAWSQHLAGEFDWEDVSVL